MLGRYRQNMSWVVLGAYAVVFALLFPRYRSRTWRVLAPTALAAVAPRYLSNSDRLDQFRARAGR